MKNDNKIRVGISMGDLNGIGCEIIIKTFEDPRMLDFCTPVVFGSNKVISYYAKALNVQLPFHGVEQAEKAVDGKFNVVNVWRDQPRISPGEETTEGGKYALKSLKAAVFALKHESIDVLVTAPISKQNIQSEEFKFPGHTDYLEQELGGNALMFMVSDEIRVGLLTDHVPVKEVSSHITEERIRKKVTTINDSLQTDFNIRRPRIAVLGINPHTGDNGVIGTEDDEVMRPTIQALNDEGIMVFGPYAADSFFGSGNHKKFDAVVAAYHDQGLIPFKTLAFGKGVNFTAGLNRVRTSPDHGTAFEIAGQGKADHSSFEEALFMAIDIYRNRSENEELRANQLKKQSMKL
ncbi:4-hydroxythreonine-4-phosphate dehydrogenase PdxA [Robertkochia aurantiaca]|uniref:4-hydroxythreonine-4-phosphate dehydrogenase PdxA n=1 Tax=Robertkochia aurantiaca TaxID=2873700 RepID=UPI001CCD8E0A|nr:4-hydroxythreonine-4-phosphate dehydrogenase PdxA [Robertkochia sp. 3YJGBD-33]